MENSPSKLVTTPVWESCQYTLAPERLSAFEPSESKTTPSTFSCSCENIKAGSIAVISITIYLFIIFYSKYFISFIP